MHILLMTMHYHPDGGPSAPLFTMLSERLARRGHRVTVLTAVPHYPSGRVPAEYQGKLLLRSRENDVDVIRVRLPSVDRAKLPRRFLQFVAYQMGAGLAALSLNPDAVLAATPAIGVWLPFAVLVWLRRKPAIYSVHDVYPEIGIKLGIFHNAAVIGIVTWLEKFCLVGANRIRILSESFVPRIRELGVREDRLRLIYDWVDTDLIRPLPRNNEFSAAHGFDRSFVVLYAGNMGLTHGLETIINAANLLRDRPDVKFVFVGEGAGKERAVRQAEHLGLSNVLFLPYQSRARLPELLASADVSLVSLQEGFGGDSLPSKTFSILASGRPVIASVDPGSDTWNLVVRSGAGLCVPPGDPQALMDAVVRLANDKELRQACSVQGRDYAVTHHSPDSAALAFEELFADVVRVGRRKAAASC
jgi:colanic acid biosynthesis glycosyl transferase WcaI